MKVRRLGGYLETDERGYLKKVADASNIGEKWRQAVAATTQAYLDRWKDAIHSVYVRGSVASGHAIEGVSDLDAFAVFWDGGFDGPGVEAWQEGAGKDLRRRFPFVSGFELGYVLIEETIEKENPWTFAIKVGAACVHGEDLAPRIPGYKPGPEIAFQTCYFRQHLKIFQDEYPLESEGERRGTLVWILRRFLRLGMELVMEEEGRFTRDLYPCYESFARHYPEKRAEMYNALELAVNPVADRKAEEFVRTFGGWLAKEADDRMESWSRAGAREENSTG